MIEDDDRPLVQYSAANYEKFGLAWRQLWLH